MCAPYGVGIDFFEVFCPVFEFDLFYPFHEGLLGCSVLLVDGVVLHVAFCL